ncbi:MAG: acetyl-CoA carboxylase biotin carboxyl carrier protein subunit [Bdellovibrionales bacterium]|nr:acetyl-CoA carboxylase biotin carboxyl carrier protein subunit [Bdellovibrionales bacterium]
MKKYIIEIDGQSVEVLAQKFKGQLWYHYNGETNCYAPDLNYGSSSSSSVSAEPGVVKAAMPGKIIKVKCQQGDRVSVGDPLVIMEAMKMEYTLKSDLDGEVTELNVSEADLVTAGQVLARVVGGSGEEA